MILFCGRTLAKGEDQTENQTRLLESGMPVARTLDKIAQTPYQPENQTRLPQDALPASRTLSFRNHARKYNHTVLYRLTCNPAHEMFQ